MGRHEEAIETCRAGLTRHPAYLSARVTLGRALIETGDYDAAREELETVLRSAPENLAAIRGLAQIHERLGQSTEMDPHLAAMMNAEVERVALAAASAPPAPPPAPSPAPIPVSPEPISVSSEPTPVSPEPIVAAAAELVLETAHVPAIPEPLKAFARVEPLAPVAPFEPVEPEEPSAPEEPSVDPAMLATLARLERFLDAIDAARHP